MPLFLVVLAATIIASAQPTYAGGASTQALDEEAASAAECPAQPIEWIRVDGTDKNPLPDWKKCGDGDGFCMGVESSYRHKNLLRDSPIRKAIVETFEISKTLVTVEQYAECVSKDRCAEPVIKDHWTCNWNKKNRQRYPMNCVSWKEAKAFAEFKGARLPSETEYYFAATSRGGGAAYPWGDDEPTCENAVICFNGSECGCALPTSPVCSKPAGNTRIAGLSDDRQLCDMTGNVAEWTSESWDAVRHEVRGGDGYNGRSDLRPVVREVMGDEAHSGYLGFRLVRSPSSAMPDSRDVACVPRHPGIRVSPPPAPVPTAALQARIPFRLARSSSPEVAKPERAETLPPGPPAPPPTPHAAPASAAFETPDARAGLSTSSVAAAPEPGESFPAGPPAPAESAPSRGSVDFVPDAGTGKLENDPIPDLITQLSSSDPRRRSRAADELGKRGAAAEPAIPALRRALRRDPERRVRSSAALALGGIGLSSGGIVTDLRRALKDKNEDVRFSAAAALEELKKPR